MNFKHRSTVLFIQELRNLSDAVSMNTIPESALADDPRPPLRPLRLTAHTAGEVKHILRLLPPALVACGGWLLHCSSSSRDASQVVFEFERSACMDVYVVLVALGFTLTHDSHVLLTHCWQAARRLSRKNTFDVITVELQLTDERAAEYRLEIAA